MSFPALVQSLEQTDTPPCIDIVISTLTQIITKHTALATVALKGASGTKV